MISQHPAEPSWSEEMSDFSRAYRDAAERHYDTHGVVPRDSRLTASKFAKSRDDLMTRSELKAAKRDNPSFMSHIRSIEAKYHQSWDGSTRVDEEDVPEGEIGAGGESWAENRAEFLRVLEQKMNHQEAQVAASIRWSAFQEILSSDEDFRAGYERIMGEVSDPRKFTKVAAMAMDVQMRAAFVEQNHTAARGLTNLVDERKKVKRGRPPKKSGRFESSEELMKRADAIYSEMIAPPGVEN